VSRKKHTFAALLCCFLLKAQAIAAPAKPTSNPAAATPTFFVPAGTYSGTQSITIDSASEPPVVCYTTNGATPATNGSNNCATGAFYADPVVITTTTTLMAVAGGAGYTDSPVATATYTIHPTAGPVVFSPSSGTFATAPTVTLTPNVSGATICFSTDGTTPTANGGGICTHGTTYTAPITVSSTELVQAIASNSGYIDSPVTAAGYAIGVGVSPYAPWANGPSTSSSYFPIGVWSQSSFRASSGEYQPLGINNFVGFYGSLTLADMNNFQTGAMPYMPDQNTIALTQTPQNSYIKSWHMIDEPDDAQPIGGGAWGACISPSQLLTYYQNIQENDTTRPAYLNFGQGVSETSWIGRGPCTGETTSYYPAAIQAADIIAFDIYPVAEYNGQLELVPNGIDNLKTWSGGTKPIWNTIEALPFNGGTTPTPSQINTEVWMSLIHGSQGIIYFVTQLSPTFREDGIFNYPTLVTAVTNINAQITSLASVLNSPTIANDVSVSSSVSSVPISMMEKQLGGTTYVFAVAMRNSSTTGTFTTPEVSSGSVTVIGESRQTPITNGQFVDSYAGYAVHLYQFPSASSSVPNPPTDLTAVVQ